MAAFAVGGVLLAGVSLAAMLRYRRRQSVGVAGRTISVTPEDLPPAERALLSANSAGIADVTWLNQALRGLAHAQAAGEDAWLPDVVAARMTEHVVELILTGPQAAAPAPWTADESGCRWSISRGAPLGQGTTSAAHRSAPYPTLASVGYTATGEHWLLHLERVAAMSLSGDVERCLNLARFLAAELAHNAWSQTVEVTLVGFGKEMAEINPDRLTYTDNVEEAITALGRHLDAVTDATRDTGVDVLAGRLHDMAGVLWAPHVLLIAPGAGADPDGLEQLLTAMRGQRPPVAVALVLADNPDHADAARWQLTIGADGTLRIPALNVELIAQQIPADEAAQLARMLAVAATTEDRPTPATYGGRPWNGHADAAGSLPPEVTAGMTVAAADEPVRRGTGDTPVPDLDESAPRVAKSVLPVCRQTSLGWPQLPVQASTRSPRRSPTRSGGGSRAPTQPWTLTWPTGTTRGAPGRR